MKRDEPKAEVILGVPETYESQNPPSLWPGQYSVKMTVGQNVSLRFTYRFGSHYTALSHDFPPGVLVEFWSNCMGDMQKVSKRTSTDITILFWFPGYKVQWHICGHVSHFSCKNHTGTVSIVIDTVIDGSVDLLNTYVKASHHMEEELQDRTEWAQALPEGGLGHDWPLLL